MRQREVAQLVAERIKLVGLSRRQIHAACEEIPEVQWRRLPLYTGASLEGQGLQRFLEFPLLLDFESFVNVYEEFVAGYLLTTEYHRFGPIAWLKKALGLSHHQAEQVFSHGKRGRSSSRVQETLPMVTGLAALANYTWGGACEWDHLSFVVAIGERRFGITAGKPVSNLQNGAKAPRLAQHYCALGLHHYRRNIVLAREDSSKTVYSQMNAWAHWQPELLGGDLEGFLLAVTMLHWRNTSVTAVPPAIRQAIEESPDPKAFQQAVRLAGGFHQFEDPYRDMRELLVPSFVSRAEFTRLFGHCRPGQRPSPQRQQQWRVELDNLAESIKEAS